jgi:predicted transcriptional regulator
VRRIDLSNFQVATSETARDINRRIVLNLIRTHQPISRADLARHSGLQRSTVSVIAEQLIKERWITEGANGHTPRGRRPRFLHLNKERVGIIGINVRPVTTTLALADLDANFLAQDTLSTPADPKQFLAELVPRVQKLMDARPELTYEGIGVSLPGRVDLATKQLVFAPNLGWSDFDLKTPLEQATQLPVELENAANSCALSEI